MKQLRNGGRKGTSQTDVEERELSSGLECLLLADPLVCPTAVVWIRRKINHMGTQLIADSDEMHIRESLFYYPCKLRAQ